jgi:hypothetical protein
MEQLLVLLNGLSGLRAEIVATKFHLAEVAIQNTAEEFRSGATFLFALPLHLHPERFWEDEGGDTLSFYLSHFKRPPLY